MMINLTALPEEIIPNMKGGEKEYALKVWADSLTKVGIGRLIPGASIGLHTHETNCEVYYFLSGTGKVMDEGVFQPVSAGSCQYCPKGQAHTLVNDGEEDLVFLTVIAEQ